jgi:maltose-binding protein MalE
MQGYDYGMNIGCIMSPKTIREIYMPLMKAVNIEIKKNGLIPFFHCCGNVWDIMDDFVDAGYKGYQSIQASAGMETKKMKKSFQEKLDSELKGKLADKEAYCQR